MKKYSTVIILLTIFLVSCQKFDAVVDDQGNLDNTKSQVTTSTMSDLKISDDFDWKMIKTVDVQITIPDESNRKITKILSLDRNTMYFNGYPEDDSNVLKTKVTFPSFVENVLIEYGQGIAGKVVSIAGDTKTLSASLINNFKSTDWETHSTASQSIYTSSLPSCTLTLTGNLGNITINNGSVYCVDEGTIVIVDKIRFKGGTLYVKGKLIVNDKIYVNGNNDAYVYVSSTGEIEANQISFNHFTEFINHGTVTDASNGGPSVDANMLFENFGTMSCHGIVNKSEDFLNAGILNVDGQFNNNGVGINEGTINVTGSNGHFNNSGNPDNTFYNYCKIFVEQHFNQNSKFYHYGYLEVEKKTNITGGGNTFMVMGLFSLIVTEDLQISGKVEGPDESGAKFKIANETKLTGAANLNGYIQFCDADGIIEVDNATKGTHIDFGCDLVIPENECNPGDGPVTPPDPETFAGTLAFEDLWPGKGDYDINDLVVAYNFEVTKNAQEKVEHITATFTVRAFGAALHNGFGFSFPNVIPSDIVAVSGYHIQSGSIYSLAGNGVENGQSKATFIVLDDPFNIMQHPGSGIGVNTDYPAPYVNPVTLVLEIEFAEGAVTYSQLDIGNFNPFIVISQIRGMEVHLPDYPPTDLHDPSYFRTFADDTNPPSKYYMTQENLPWAINIPAQFDYPVERQIILGAYYHFAEWAESSGTSYLDWFKDLPGYRNASVIY